MYACSHCPAADMGRIEYLTHSAIVHNTPIRVSRITSLARVPSDGTLSMAALLCLYAYSASMLSDLVPA